MSAMHDLEYHRAMELAYLQQTESYGGAHASIVMELGLADYSAFVRWRTNQRLTTREAFRRLMLLTHPPQPQC